MTLKTRIMYAIQSHTSGDTLRHILTAGFAMFSMFFGSGNLIFPLLIGYHTTTQFPMGLLGLFITAVLIPFLGVLGMVLYAGDRTAYFSRLGKIPAYLLILSMLALMGPFGVVPRCLTVAYGSLQPLFPELSLRLFGAAFCLLLLGCTWHRNNIVHVIGVWLTPIKLSGVFLLIVVGIWQAGPLPPETLLSLLPMQALGAGMRWGYQTMDLIAAFFFSSTIVAYFQTHIRTSQATESHAQNVFYASLAACCIGAVILALCYCGFVMLGAYHAPNLITVPPESMLATIGIQTLGKSLGIPIVVATMVVGCLATAAILTTLFVDFVYDTTRSLHIPYHVILVVSLAVAYLGSLWGFSAVCQWLTWILVVAYPALIMLAISNLWEKLRARPLSPILFWGGLALSMIIGSWMGME